MDALTHDQLTALLGTQQIPGSKKEQAILRIRIGELVALNGEKWVRQNQKRLIDQWALVVENGLIAPK